MIMITDILRQGDARITRTWSLAPLIAIAMSLLWSTAQAQQDPMYTMYMWNTLSVNPGYAVGGARWRAEHADAYRAHTLADRKPWRWAQRGA